MPFDFDRLASLRNDPIAFENERSKLIDEMFDAMPQEKQIKYRALQNELDHLRKTMGSEAFLAELFRRMGENISDIGDQANTIQVILEKGSDHKPVLTNIKNRIALAPSGFTFTSSQGKMNP